MKTKTRRPAPKNNPLPQPAKNTPVPAEPAEEMLLQFGENEVAIAAISEKVKNSYKESGSEAEIKDIKIYVKPEDNKAYYVINGEISSSVDLV